MATRRRLRPPSLLLRSPWSPRISFTFTQKSLLRLINQISKSVFVIPIISFGLVAFLSFFRSFSGAHSQQEGKLLGYLALILLISLPLPKLLMREKVLGQALRLVLLAVNTDRPGKFVEADVYRGLVIFRIGELANFGLGRKQHPRVDVFMLAGVFNH